MDANQFNRRARRAARKQGKKLGRKLTAEEIKKLKVQTISLWAQVTMGLSGSGLITGGIYLVTAGEILLGTVVALIGLLFLIYAIVGKKETVEEIAGEILVKPVEYFIEGIFSAF